MKCRNTTILGTDPFMAFDSVKRHGIGIGIKRHQQVVCRGQRVNRRSLVGRKDRIKNRRWILVNFVSAGWRANWRDN